MLQQPSTTALSAHLCKLCLLLWNRKFYRNFLFHKVEFCPEGFCLTLGAFSHAPALILAGISCLLLPKLPEKYAAGCQTDNNGAIHSTYTAFINGSPATKLSSCKFSQIPVPVRRNQVPAARQYTEGLGPLLTLTHPAFSPHRDSCLLFAQHKEKHRSKHEHKYGDKLGSGQYAYASPLQVSPEILQHKPTCAVSIKNSPVTCPSFFFHFFTNTSKMKK